jgi:hypothetical protein
VWQAVSEFDSAWMSGLDDAVEMRPPQGHESAEMKAYAHAVCQRCATRRRTTKTTTTTMMMMKMMMRVR